MDDKKTVAYVSSTTNYAATKSLCAQLPVKLKKVNSIEELFSLLSDSSYHIDYVCISIRMIHQRPDKLDMFDIIRTVSTLIKSTEYRADADQPPGARNAKIIVIANEDSNVELLRELKQIPEISTISWTPNNSDDVKSITEHLRRIISGDFTFHPKVLGLLKPKKKNDANKDVIDLTARQEQILKLIKERGVSNKVIARMLGISESTVKFHVGSILKKYCVRNRTQLAVFSREKFLPPTAC